MGGEHPVCRLLTMESLTMKLSVRADGCWRTRTVPTWAIDRPVVDATGLTGEYDFVIDFGSSKRAIPSIRMRSGSSMASRNSD